MANMNMFFLDGNVVRNLELRRTRSGRPVVTYTVAVDNIYYVEGVKQSKTDYIPITRYDSDAENDHRYLRRGSGVTVTGAIRSWWDREAKKGGFIFEAHGVKYQPSSGAESPPAASPTVQHPAGDDWLRDYETSEQGAWQR